MKSRLFILPPGVMERIERSAKDENKGGWQSLCAEILRNEVDDGRRLVQHFRREGIQEAITTLQGLDEAEAAE